MFKIGLKSKNFTAMHYIFGFPGGGGITRPQGLQPGPGQPTPFPTGSQYLLSLSLRDVLPILLDIKDDKWINTIRHSIR